MLATGQGGMFVTDDDKVFERAISIYNHGRDADKGTFFSSEVGFNYKMSNLVAAMGLAQLKRIEELISHKHMLRDLYITRLGNIEGFEFQKECNGAKSNWSYPSIRIDPKIINRDKLIDELAKRGIDTRPVFPRMSTMPAFKEVSAPRAELISKTGINLPTAGMAKIDFDIKEWSKIDFGLGNLDWLIHPKEIHVELKKELKLLTRSTYSFQINQNKQSI